MDPLKPSNDIVPEGLEAGPGDLVIGSKNRPLVVIRASGELRYGPDYSPDKAAAEFWEAMARQRLQVEERLLLVNHMEGVLTQLGAADLHNEAMQLRLQEKITTARLTAAQRAHSALERAVHQAIELGRGIARRPMLMEIPKEVPRQIAEDPNNSYQGQEGFTEPSEGSESLGVQQGTAGTPEASGPEGSSPESPGAPDESQ